MVVAAHQKTLTWEQVNYHVPVAGGTRRLLHNVYGYVKPGTLTALMYAFPIMSRQSS
jgi:ATP-binding cassette subfamily G (WHITE) protein 2 (SNQ2)